MKALKMFGMALMAVFVGINISSCSIDGDTTDGSPQYELVASEKRLEKIEYTISGLNTDFIEVWDFSYDSEGKLIEATFTDGYKNKTNAKYTWSNNLIDSHVKKYHNSDITPYSEYENTYNLKNGLVQDYGIIYNESKRPKEITGTSIMWHEKYEDMLYRITTPFKVSENHTIYDSTQYYYNKNGIECNGYNPFIPIELTNEEIDFLFIVHPELAGMRSVQIPTSFLDDDILAGMTQGTYSHSLDNEGYISEFRIKAKGDSSYYIYTMTWK